MNGRVDPHFLAELRRRTSLAELIGQRVALKRAGRELRGVCPFHTEKTPSFYVVEDKGFWHCFGCSAHGDAIGWVQKTMTATDFREAVEYLAARAGISQTGPRLDAKPIVARPADEALKEARKRKVDGARQIWAGHVPAGGTLAERYLRARRIGLELPPTIGFVPALAHPFLGFRAPGLPAMVAPFQAVDRTIVGVHCTYLARDGLAKAPEPVEWPAGEPWKQKIIRGAFRGGAIRLTASEDVLVLAEGIETALSVLQALWDDDSGCPHIDGEPVAVWAAGSLDNMGALEPPDGVREIVLAADGDGKVPDADSPHKDPEELIALAARKHRDAGRTVRIARPPAGTDFNDLVPDGFGARDDEREEAA